MFTYRRLMFLLAVGLVIGLLGCQTSSPETVEVPVTVEVTRVVEVVAERPEPEVVEVEVTRIVEVPVEPAAAEPAESEERAINPMMPIEFDAISSAITGRDYVLTIALPGSYMFTEANYPVIYVTDGDFYAIPLAMAAAQLSFGQELPEFIVVGVDYGVPDPMAWLELRDLDMGPEGSAAFLQFFQEELIPYVESAYRADPANRTLMGHSSGGDFALYGLLNGSDTFSKFIASSPSRAAAMTDAVEAFAAGQSEVPVRLFLSAGDMDLETAAGVEAFDEALTNVGGDRLSYLTMILDGETHLSSRPRAFNSGLRWVFATEGE